MRRFLRTARRALPHLVIILSVVFMVFLVLNRFNPMMGFLSNKYSRPMLWVFCVAALAESILLVSIHRRRRR